MDLRRLKCIYASNVLVIKFSDFRMMFLSLIVVVALAVKVTTADLVHGKNPFMYIFPSCIILRAFNPLYSDGFSTYLYSNNNIIVPFCIKGSPVSTSQWCISVPEDCCHLTNRTYSDDMTQYTTFLLNLHCLSLHCIWIASIRKLKRTYIDRNSDFLV